MKWLIRCVSLAIAAIVGASPLVVTAFLSSDGWKGLGTFLIFCVLLPVGWLICVLIGIPGLILLERRGWNRWPWGAALGAVVGAVTTSVSLGTFTLLASLDPKVHIGTTVLSFLGTALWGAGMGLLGAGTYWAVNRSMMRWTSETAEQLRLESSLRNLSAEDREALQSRLDR